MSDVSELVGKLRGPIKHPQQSASLRLEAADALETLAGEVAGLRAANDRLVKAFTQQGAKANDAVAECDRLDRLVQQRTASAITERDRADAAESRLAKMSVEVKDLETELEYVKKQREDYFSEYRQKLTEYTEMKIALAKLAPVVEAACQVLAHSSGFEGDLAFCKKMAALESAISTMGAAHD